MESSSKKESSWINNLKANKKEDQQQEISFVRNNKKIQTIASVLGTDIFGEENNQIKVIQDPNDDTEEELDDNKSKDNKLQIDLDRDNIVNLKFSRSDSQKKIDELKTKKIIKYS